MIIGINALNIKSGGGIKHISNLLKNFENNRFLKKKIKKIIIWVNPLLKKKLNLNKNYFEIINLKLNAIQIFFWKILFLNKNLKKKNCDVLYSPDGIFFFKYIKNIVFFQNLIPFSYREIIRYEFSFQTLKLFITRLLYMLSAKRSDGIIFLNDYAKKKIFNLLDLKKKYLIVPHGIDKSYYKIKFNKKRSVNVRNIIYISPIDLYKNQWNVITAINNLNKKGYNLKLHLVGSISNNFARKIFFSSYSKNSNIIYHGELNEKRILKLLKKMDLYIFASSCESMGLTLLEGMATRMPVICSKLSDMRTTTKNLASYFNPENITSIEYNLKKLINNKKKLVENARETRKLSYQYNWKECSKKTFDFISRVVDEK